MRANSLVQSTDADSPIVRAVPVGAWRSPVSAPVWGTGGRGFKSRRPDQQNQRLTRHLERTVSQKNATGKHLGNDDVGTSLGRYSRSEMSERSCNAPRRCNRLL